MKVARWALVALLAFSLTGGVAQAKNAKQTVDEAAAKGKKGVQALVDSRPAPEVAAELLSRSVTTEGEGTYANPLTPPDPLAVTARKGGKKIKARIATACQGAVSRRITVSSLGVTLAWRQVREGYWCWGGGRITSWDGASYTDWNAFPYCWRNENRADTWQVYPTVRYTYNQGTLGVNYQLGCGTSQTITPYIHYRDGGSYYF